MGHLLLHVHLLLVHLRFPLRFLSRLVRRADDSLDIGYANTLQNHPLEVIPMHGVALNVRVLRQEIVCTECLVNG